MSSIVIQGDTSGSITVEAPSVAGTHTLTLPKATGNIATDATVGLGMKNRIINGNMVIDQRNGGASVTQSSASNLYTVDRWQVAGTVNAAFTAQQSSTVPDNFVKSLVLTSSASTSPAASDFFGLIHKVEGYNFADLGFGTSAAKTITLSFWVRSSVTGTFTGTLNNSSAGRCFPFSYTISSANTWEQKSITVAGDTTGTWLTTNGLGVQIFFALGGGSNWKEPAGSWTSTLCLMADGQTDWISTSGATFYITGVQLEQSDNATPFENRMYGTELALCQRYFYKSYGQDTGAVPVTSSGWLGSRHAIAYSVADLGCDVRYPVPMRTTPTVTIYHQDGTSSAVYEIITGAKKAVGGTLYGNDSGFWHLNSSSLFTTNYHYYFQITASAEL